MKPGGWRAPGTSEQVPVKAVADESWSIWRQALRYTVTPARAVGPGLPPLEQSFIVVLFFPWSE